MTEYEEDILRQKIENILKETFEFVTKGEENRMMHIYSIYPERASHLILGLIKKL